MPIRIFRQRLTAQPSSLRPVRNALRRCRRIDSAIRAARGVTFAVTKCPAMRSLRKNRSCCDGDHILIVAMSLACPHHKSLMEGTMTNGIAQVVIGIALAAAIGGVAALNPGYKPHEDVAYLERVAATVERAKVLAPETREQLSKLTSRYETLLSDAQLDLKRQKALGRIRTVMLRSSD